MVGNAAFVLIEKPRYVDRIEYAGASYSLGRQKISRQWPQLELQPFCDWNTETFLSSTYNEWRQQVGNGALENVLGILPS